VLYYRKVEWGHTEQVLGRKLTQADIDLEVFQLALLLLEDFAKETQYTGEVQLLTDSPSAPQQLLDFGQHATQHASLTAAWKIDALLTDHPQLVLKIQ